MKVGIKRAAMAILSVSLVMTSLSGCSKKADAAFDADAVVLTVNDEDVSAGLLKFATHYAQSQYQYYYELYFGENPFQYEYYEGYTIGDMTKDETLTSLEEMILAKQHMDEYGVSLTDDELSEISEAAAGFIADNDEEVLTAMCATQEIVEEYLTLIKIETKMEPAMSADVDTEVSDEEAAQRRIEYVLITAETEEEIEEETEEETEEKTEEETEEEETALLSRNETVKTASEGETEDTDSEDETAAAEDSEDETEAAENSEEDTSEDESETAGEEEEEEEEEESETEDPAVVAAMEKAYDKAQQIIDLIVSGMDFDDAIAQIDDSLTSHELTFGSDSTTVASALIESTEGLGDDTLVGYPVEASSGYYVVKVISEIDREATDSAKESIVEDRKEETITELFEEWDEDSDLSFNSNVYSTVTFDFNLSLYEETEAETDSESEEAEEETDSESEGADEETDSESEGADEESDDDSEEDLTEEAESGTEE